ncbi:MAG: hypothetical protein KDC71_14670 [Acidobacteria bacterium]|nr:hypothetical protein [Acidobacteriota bacterium]
MKALGLLFLSCLLWSQDVRVLTHIPPPRTLYDTWVWVVNASDSAQSFAYSGFNEAGELLQSETGQVDAHQSLRIKSTVWVDDPSLSHCTVSGDVSFFLEYTSPFSESLALLVPEDRPTDNFTFVLPQANGQFLGLALANPGDEPVRVSWQIRELSGELAPIRSPVGEISIEANGKAKYLFKSDQEEWALGKSVLVLSADHAVTATLLAGQPPYQQGAQLMRITPSPGTCP